MQPTYRSFTLQITASQAALCFVTNAMKLLYGTSLVLFLSQSFIVTINQNTSQLWRQSNRYPPHSQQCIPSTMLLPSSSTRLPSSSSFQSSQSSNPHRSSFQTHPPPLALTSRPPPSSQLQLLPPSKDRHYHLLPSRPSPSQMIDVSAESWKRLTYNYNCTYEGPTKTVHFAEAIECSTQHLYNCGEQSVVNVPGSTVSAARILRREAMEVAKLSSDGNQEMTKFSELACHIDQRVSIYREGLLLHDGYAKALWIGIAQEYYIFVFEPLDGGKHKEVEIDLAGLRKGSVTLRYPSEEFSRMLATIQF
jgi:hypothetical protein